MSKRLKYTKDILTHMLSNNSGANTKPASKRQLQRFSSTTGFQKTNPAKPGTIAKFSSARKFRTLSRGPSSEKGLFETNYFAK